MVTNDNILSCSIIQDNLILAVFMSGEARVCTLDRLVRTNKPYASPILHVKAGGEAVELSDSSGKCVTEIKGKSIYDKSISLQDISRVKISIK